MFANFDEKEVALGLEITKGIQNNINRSFAEGCAYMQKVNTKHDDRCLW